MIETLVSFAGIAVLVSLTPGPATALVVRSAAVRGRREALLVTLGNSTGIFMWAIASVLGISALVAASETAFWVLKIVGAVVLLYLGLQALRGTRSSRAATRHPSDRAAPPTATGCMTSFANPKLAVFFIALFPQFVPDGDAVLPTTLAMALLLIAVDLVYFSLLALVVSRAHHAVVPRSSRAGSSVIDRRGDDRARCPRGARAALVQVGDFNVPQLEGDAAVERQALIGVVARVAAVRRVMDAERQCERLAEWRRRGRLDRRLDPGFAPARVLHLRAAVLHAAALQRAAEVDKGRKAAVRPENVDLRIGV